MIWVSRRSSVAYRVCWEVNAFKIKSSLELLKPSWVTVIICIKRFAYCQSYFIFLLISGREILDFGYIILSLSSAFWDIRKETKAAGAAVLSVKSRATWMVWGMALVIYFSKAAGNYCTGTYACFVKRTVIFITEKVKRKEKLADGMQASR